MHIAIRATQQQKEELFKKGFDKSVTIEWFTEIEMFKNKADAFFDLTFNDANLSDNNFIHDTIVFANAVCCTCKEIKQKNYVRINAWNGFLSRSLIELTVCDDDYKKRAGEIFNALNWKFTWTPDDYGFIAARIISMIINEAYYALQENVSNKEQIDIAMKLGTNYPFGPFEWSEKIGIKKIYSLLKKLSSQNKRYTIAALLQQTATENKKINWRLF